MKANQGKYEDLFLWNDNNIIAGLSDKGRHSKVIVIPKRCEGFKGLILAENKNEVEEVKFESDSNLDLRGTFKHSDTLKKITLPAEQKELTKGEFDGCSALESISIPKNITYIPGKAFQDNTSLKSVVFEGDKVVRIEDDAFNGCVSLETVKLPDSLQSVGPFAFYECTSLKKIAFPASIKDIDQFAFSNSGIEELYFNANAVPKEINTTAFSNLPHSVKVHVVKGTALDKEFSDIFTDNFEKVYN